jgi:glycerol-3-phosphate acyltransferase PlsY
MLLTTGFWISCAVVAALSYLLGSFNFGVIVSKGLEKDDIRGHGSGNAGMTNMLRVFGAKQAALTALGDFAKAVAAVVIARLIFARGGFPTDYAGYVAGLFVLLGHLFPLYFQFKGGKGVVTMLGVVLVVNPIVFLIVCAIFIPLAFITRIVSLSSILGAISFPLLTLLVRLLQGRPFLFETLCAVLTGGIIVFVHRGNIRRLLNGTESRIEKKK